MGNDTQQLEKTNPMRLWLERHLGKVILTSIPVVMLSLAGWIYTIGNEIAVIKEKMKEDVAQWSALLAANEKIRDLEIETRVNQKLMYLVVEKKVDPDTLRVERLLEDSTEGEEADSGDEDVSALTSRDNDKRPLRIRPKLVIPRKERLEDFKQQQIQQMAK